MKKIFFLLLTLSLTGGFLSCKKDTLILPSNKPPIANAGPDKAITLPTNISNLDGGGSTIGIIISPAMHGRRSPDHRHSAF